MKKQAVIKIAVTSHISKDLYDTIHYFLNQSLNSKMYTSDLFNWSLRVSYRGPDSKVEYTPVFSLENATKKYDYHKLTDEAIHRINNKRIAFSTITSLHMHLIYK